MPRCTFETVFRKPSPKPLRWQIFEIALIGRGPESDT